MIDLIKSGTEKIFNTKESFKYNTKSTTMPKTIKDQSILFEPSYQSEEDYIDYKESLKYETDSDLRKEALEKILGLEEKQVRRLKEEVYDLEELTLDEISNVINQLNTSTYDTVSSYNHKIDRLKEHTDSMYTYGLKKQGTLTINDLYKGSFSGSINQSNKSYSSEDVKSVLNMNSIDLTKGNEWAASKLLGLGMDVSKDSVLKIQNIHTAIEELEHYEVGQEELEEINERKLEDKILLEDEKVVYDKETIADLKEDLTKVDGEVIKEVIGTNQDITIGNLRETMLKNTQKVTGQTRKEKIDVADESLEVVKSEVNEADVEEVKKQINEIRARLNTETAQKLSAVMPLESSELAKVAEGLRQIELEVSKDALVKADVALTEENNDNLKKVMEAARKMGEYKELATKVQVESEGEATLEVFHEVINRYEENGTVAEKRFGETISKVEGQIEQFLSSHQLPQDELTVQSAKALILNEMDLTLENLQEAKIALSKINEFLNVMNPYEAAKLIKEGMNPYTASIETIVEGVKQGELVQMKESIASAIMNLEDKGKISEEQKQSLIGLYRILNGVVLHKEQVAGYLFKNEMPLTVEKLEEAVKYAGKKETIQAVIDDQFGLLEEAKYDTKTARKLIEEASSELKKLLEAVGMVESMPLEIEKDNVDELTALKSMLYPFIKATIKKETGKFEGLDTLPESLLEKIRVVKDTSDDVLKTMKKHDIALTLSNIYWVDRLSKEPELYEEMIKNSELQKSLQDKGFPDKVEDLEETLRELQEKATEEKELCMDKGDLMGYKSYKQLEEMASIQKELMDKEGIYQIPFVIDGESKMVQLYIKEESQKKDIHKEGINAVMRYDTKALGTVTTYFTIKGDHIGYEMHTETKASQEALEKTKDQLKVMMDALGYSITKEAYASTQQAKEPITKLVLRGDSQFETII